MEGGTPAATALLVAAFRLLVFAARLRADFSFRFRAAFFAADILPLRIGIPFASHAHRVHSRFRHTMTATAVAATTSRSRTASVQFIRALPVCLGADFPTPGWAGEYFAAREAMPGGPGNQVKSNRWAQRSKNRCAPIEMEHITKPVARDRDRESLERSHLYGQVVEIILIAVNFI
jgi:hypothetical protein